MERLTYDDYVKFGGTSSIGDFPIYNLDCEMYLKQVTFGRIEKIALNDDVKRCMVRIIDGVLMNAQANGGNNALNGAISSYSDGIESISYATPQTLEKDRIFCEIRRICKTYLPPKLIYKGSRRDLDDR